MAHRTRLVIAVALLATLVLTACGGQATTTAVSNDGQSQLTLPAVSNGEGGGEGGGVEAALVTYSDSAQGFAIGHPGPWTQDASVTQGVKFVGGGDSLTLEFVTPPTATDAMTYAKNDVAAVSVAFPGFKQLSLAASTEVKDAVILGFEATGTSAVTGKTFSAHDERYYMPLSDGRIAILTVVGPSNHYDREGVRDIALTFKVTK
jgi:predicted small secreted protein